MFLPKKDECTTCTAYANTKIKADQLRQNLIEHHENVELSRANKQRDKARAAIDESFFCGIADLEQVSPCPKGFSKDFFYVSKLSCYNFTTLDLKTRKGHCYRWDQRQGRRGANEMASARLHFYNNVVPKSVTEVTEWSDSCGAQNRGHKVSAAIIQILKDPRNNITRFNKKWMTSGHSESEVDVIHSVLERKSKDKEFFHPEQWITFNQDATDDSGQKFEAHKLGLDMIPIYDVTNYAMLIFLNKRKGLDNTTGQSVLINWNNLHQMEYGRAISPFTLVVKENFYPGVKGVTVDTQLSKLTRSSQKKKCIPKLIVLRNDSSHPFPITKKLKSGLLKLCKKMQIPHQFQQFYHSLLETGHLEDEDEDDVERDDEL